MSPEEVYSHSDDVRFAFSEAFEVKAEVEVERASV